MIEKIYKTLSPSFIKPSKNVDINFNAACHTYLSQQSLEGFMYYHENFGICSGRGSSKLENKLEDTIEEIRDFILKRMDLPTSEFEVVFTKNATEALNMAYSIIGNHVEQTCKESWEIAVHPLAHKSLIAPAQKLAKEYDVSWRELSVKKDPKENNIVLPSTWFNDKKIQICDFIYGLPYLDNVYGINHWSSYVYETLPNSKFQSMPLKGRHIILDATQALPYIFSKEKRTENTMYVGPTSCFANAPMRSAGAIAFSTHKFHCMHLGVLVINKKYLEDEDFYKLNNITVGGGNLDFSNGSFKSNTGYRGLEAGLQDIASIFAFGAFIHHLSKNSFYKIKELNKINQKIKRIIREESNNYMMPLPAHPVFSNIVKYSNNNIIGVTNDKRFDADVVSSLFSDEKIQLRTGKFCADYFFSKYKTDEFLRLSYDYSFLLDLEKNIEDFRKKLSNVVCNLGDLHFSKQANTI